MTRQVDTSFDVLFKMRGARAAEVLLSALDEPDAHIQARSVTALTHLHSSQGCRTIIDSFDRLESPARAEIVAAYDVFLPPIRAALRTGKVAQRENALAILVMLGKTRLASTVAGALTDSARKIRAQAGAALVAMAHRLHDVLTRVSLDAQDAGTGSPLWRLETARRELLTALRAGMKSYTHHRELAVLEAFVLLGAAAQDELIAQVEAGSAELANDFVKLLRRDAARLEAGLLVKCMLCESAKVQEVVHDILYTRKGEAFTAQLEHYLDAVLGHSSLTLSKDNGRSWWQIASARLDHVSEPFQKKMVKTAVTQLKGAACIQHLEALTASPFPSVRREVLLAAREDLSETARALTIAMMTDPDESVQLLATQEVIALDVDQKMEPLIEQLQSHFDSVRNLAISEVSRAGFQRYLAGFDNLDTETRKKAGAALAKIDGGIVDRLIDELDTLETDRRIRALKIVQTIDKAPNVSNAILQLVSDEDKRVRATAVIALGAIGSGAALKAMIEALSDPDRRVQANAIEAFETLNQPDFADVLLPFTMSADNRIRANAVKALWYLGHPEATTHLQAMLRDTADSMRLSAAWLLGELAIPGAPEALAKLGVGDPSEVVRRKAKSVLQRISEDGS